MAPSNQKRKGKRSNDNTIQQEPAETENEPTQIPEKRKLDSRDEPPISADLLAEPTIEERLEQMDVSAEDAEEIEPPKADSLAVLLEQGLTSQDLSIIRSVLSRTDDAVIRKTLELLPARLTVPLIEYLGKMCAEERPRSNKAALTWLSLALTIRASYLTSLPNLAEVLRPIRIHSDRRSRQLHRFIQLSGVITASVNLVKQRQLHLSSTASATHSHAPLLVYREDGDETESEEDQDMSDDDNSSDESSVGSDDAGRARNKSDDTISEDESDELGEPPKKNGRKAEYDSDGSLEI